MAYKIHFMGLVCLVEQSDGTFLAALADGSDPIDPRTGTPLLPHFPYVVCIAGQWRATNWQPEVEVDGSSFFRIDPGAVLEFDSAVKPGEFDATQFEDQTYRWKDLDPDFLINDTANPKGTLAKANLRRGTFHLSRNITSKALVAHVTIRSETSAVTLKKDGVVRTITFSGDREIAVANVSEDFVLHSRMPRDHKDDFFIHYIMNEGSQPPSGNIPQPNATVPETNDHDGVHPVLARSQDLNVSCSPIRYR